MLSGVLAYDAFTSYISPYLSVAQVVENSNAYLNEDIQILGTVSNGSVTYTHNLTLFNLIDEQFMIKVNYVGRPPNNFQEGGEVVVVGRLISRTTIESSSMLVKCPSKYEGEGESLFSDPIFLVAMVVGCGAIVGTVVSALRKKDSDDVSI